MATNKNIYLDYAATTPTDPRVVEAMIPYFTEHFGNPSTLYMLGQQAKKVLEEAREKVAQVIGAKPEEIIFTSGGTESNNFALIGTAYANEKKGNEIITTTIEHHSLLETCKFLGKRGFKIIYLPVDKYGLVNPDDVKKALTSQTILISIMHANNEIGTIEPIAEIAKIAKENEVYFHTDAVQTVGSVPVNVEELGVDLLSMSSHKLYGPKGVGALYIRKRTRMIPLLHGGNQERRRRAGTENIPGIIGFAKACEIAEKERQEHAEKLIPLRDKLIEGILERIDDVRLNGHPTTRLPNNVNVSIEFVEGESMLLNLDFLGIAAASGSACASDTLDPSHVLLAIGIPHEVAHGSLRFSLGRETTKAHIDYVLEVLPKVTEKLRALSPYQKKWATGTEEYDVTTRPKHGEH